MSGRINKMKKDKIQGLRNKLLWKLNTVGGYETHKEMWDAFYKYEEALKQEQEQKQGQTLPLAVVGSSFFIEDLRSKLKVAKMEMDNANNPTSAIKATGKMLAYKDILDGIKNGYYK